MFLFLNINVIIGFEEFLILSSTKQNVELYKILRAIADEVESLKVNFRHNCSRKKLIFIPQKY